MSRNKTSLRSAVKCSNKACMRLIVDKDGGDAYAYPNFTVIMEREGVVGAEYVFCSPACFLGFALSAVGSEEMP